MGYYVPKQKIPEECRDCHFYCYASVEGETFCCAGEFIMAENSKPLPFDGRHSNCPLIEVPDDHGNLIDRDALVKEAFSYELDDGDSIAELPMVFLKDVEEAPVIVPSCLERA